MLVIPLVDRQIIEVLNPTLFAELPQCVTMTIIITTWDEDDGSHFRNSPIQTESAHGVDFPYRSHQICSD